VHGSHDGAVFDGGETKIERFKQFGIFHDCPSSGIFFVIPLSNMLNSGQI
jgi:hypothetical protein